jgi:hypothetical protein
MKILALFFISMFFAVISAAANPPTPQKMRPYAGIGILHLPINNTDPGDPPLLYEEPALSRMGELNRSKIPVFDWILGSGPSSAAQSLIVTARKGTWLRVVYDDAGREAWLNPSRHFELQSWDMFFKGHVSCLLPGLQQKYYQVFQQAGTSPLAALKINQPFRVLQIDNDWAMVLIEQNSLGWLRWRDEDGRLLIGLVKAPMVQLP